MSPQRVPLFYFGEQQLQHSLQRFQQSHRHPPSSRLWWKRRERLHLFLGADQSQPEEGNLGSFLLARQTGFPRRTSGKVWVR
jgi:hypothetical protein